MATTFVVYPEFIGSGFRPAASDWGNCSAMQAVAAALQADSMAVVASVQFGSVRIFGALPGGIA